MNQEIFKQKENESSFKVGSEVTILIDGIKDKDWKITKIFENGPLVGRALVEKERPDVLGGKIIVGKRMKKRMVGIKSLQEWNS